MFRNAHVHRIEHWATPTLTDMEGRSARSPLVACGASQHESAGCMAPRGDAQAPLAESMGGQVTFKPRSRAKAVTGGVQ